jgi:hypothetical protein
MTLRRAAALALVGWYLMMAPYVGNSFDYSNYRLNAPLSKWRMINSLIRLRLAERRLSSLPSWRATRNDVPQRF